MDALKARHTLEMDILNSGLKAVAPKGFMGKKASPAALASHETTCKAKREELQERHAKETAMFLENPACFDAVVEKAVEVKSSGVKKVVVEEEEEEEEGGELDGEDGLGGAGGGGLKLSRKDRRQAKKAAQEAAAAAAAESATSRDRPNPEGTAKEREFKALTAQLQPLSLKIHPIPADGNCLYRAVADQLLTLAAAAAPAPAPPSTPDHRTLRTRAADFIRVYWEDFAPFLPYEEGDAYPAAEAAGEVRSAVARYCDRMATSASWGGHPEIRALANVLGCPIVVYREGSPPLEFNPKGEERALGVGGGGGGGSSRRQLCITFHAHALASGEHYNSARVVV